MPHREGRPGIAEATNRPTRVRANRSRRASATPQAIYQTSAVNGRRHRSTKAELAEYDAAIYDIAEAQHPIPVRGIFYQMVSPHGLVPKTDKAHKDGTLSGYGIVQREVLKMRRRGDLPYGWITDGTRLRLQPQTWSSAQAALEHTARTYRQALWADQDVHVEFWSEKDTVRGTVFPVTAQFDVPLMIARGQSSDTFIFETAEAINHIDKPAHIYQLGDHDRDGVRAWNAIKRKLRGFVSDHIELSFGRIAVTPEQIEQYGLLTRPDKTDSGFGACVEVDAIPPSTLRGLVRETIERHIDPKALRVTKIAEKSEREILTRMVNGWDQ